ncbi:Modification methylase DpnIIA [Anaerolineae bacterium]|nr:Modification methylase DpnIIA [Anaerolineae bacterium]
MTEARPVVKWPGGKGQLLDRLEPLFPRKFNRYIEPFAGAGAVFFRLHNLGLIGANPRVRKSPAIVNDLNAELMNVYCVVRDQVDDLIEELARHQAHIGDEAYYYYIRNLDREPGFVRSSPVTSAARTIFLNKTGYNGLYRVNAGGLFNVPFGQHKKPTVLDQPLLHVVSRALQRVELMSSDFAWPLRQARKHDFVYIDPPYQPLSRTANFVAYTAGGFGWEQQERLAEWIGRLAKRGCYVLINNADTLEIRALYEAVFKGRAVDFKLQSFETARSINREGKNRRGAQELTVWNY